MTPRAHRAPGARPSSARRSRAGWRTRARAGRRRPARAAGRGSSDSERRLGREPEVVDRGVDDLLDRAPLRPRLGGAALEPREVEQVVDQPRQPRALRRDHAAELAPLRRPSSVGDAIASPAATIAVSGVRRSCETARSSVVLTTSARRSARVSTDLAEQPVALQRLPRAAPRGSARPAPAAAAAPPPAGPRGTQQRAELASSPRAAGTRRCRSSPSTGASSIDADGRLERRREPLRGGGQRLRQLVAAQQQPRHLGRQVGLAPPLLGLGRARPRDLRHRAADHRDDQEHDQRDPVLAVGDREAPRRRDVEEVERQRATRPRSATPSHAPQTVEMSEHRDEVDDAERHHRRHRRAAGTPAPSWTATTSTAATRPRSRDGGATGRTDGPLRRSIRQR